MDNLAVHIEESFDFIIPAFSDEDDANLEYELTLMNGDDLTGWLNFNDEIREIEDTP